MSYVYFNRQELEDEIPAPLKRVAEKIKQNISSPEALMTLYSLYREVERIDYEFYSGEREEEFVENTKKFLRYVMYTVISDSVIVPIAGLDYSMDLTVVDIDHVVAVGTLDKLDINDNWVVCTTPFFDIVKNPPKNPFQVLKPIEGKNKIRADKSTKIPQEIMMFYRENTRVYVNKKYLDRAIRLILTLEGKKYNKKNLKHIKYYIADDYPLLVIGQEYFALVAPLEKEDVEKELSEDGKK